MPGQLIPAQYQLHLQKNYDYYVATLESVMSKSRLYAIWYTCIALGFAFLGVHRMVHLHGDGAWLRFLIAAGFGALAILQARARE